MLVEDLRELPVGTQVVGDLKVTRAIPGVVESMKCGPHFIRWADGYVTFPFGWVQDYDEYVAARTEVQPSTRIHLEPDRENEMSESTPNPETEQAVLR
jgi:hypothetical protein